MRNLLTSGLPCLALFLLLSLGCAGQQVIFCESVDAAGKPSGNSNTFSIAAQGSYLNVLVKLPSTAGTTRIIYDLYQVDSLGRETFESSSFLEVRPEWTWFNKGFTFYRPGTYAVYIYDNSERLIIAGNLVLVRK